MASTKIKSTACAVIFAGLLTPAVMQQRALTAVRQETETLRRATQDFSPPLRQMTASAEPLNDAGRDELARLRRDHVDLLRLRGEMGRRLRAAEVQAALDRNVEEGARRWKREVSDREKELKKCTETKLTGGFKLVEARNAGQGTPEATLQSFIWALANQDAAALAELQWPGILPITFPPDKWLEFNEQSCAAFRADHTDGVSGINLLSLRKYAEDRVEVLYGFDSEQPRRPGRPPGGILLVRRIDDRWLIEHDRNSLPGDLERFRAGAPVIETPNP